MSFSYTDPSNSRSDAVRFLVGDTRAEEPLLQDEEIGWLIEQWEKHTDYWIAACAADAIAAKLARETSIVSDGQSLTLSELQQKYKTLAEDLRAQDKALLVGGALHAGGMDAGKQLDPTVAPLAFGTRMHDNHEAGLQDLGSFSDVLSSWDAGQWGEFTS